MRRLLKFSREVAITFVLVELGTVYGAFAASIDEQIPKLELGFIEKAKNRPSEILPAWLEKPGYYLHWDLFRLGPAQDTLQPEAAELPPGRLKLDPYFEDVQTLRDGFTVTLPYEQYLIVAYSESGDGQPDFSLLTSDLTPEETFLPPDQAFVLSARFREDGTLVARWDIADGYYLYRDKFAVNIAAGSRGVVESMDLSPGIRKADAYFGEVDVHYGYAELVVTLSGIGGEGEPIELDVEYQGCAEMGLCYPPITKLVVLEAVAP